MNSLAVARNTELWQWEYKLRAPYTPTIPLVARRDRVYAELSNPVELGDETFVTLDHAPPLKFLYKILHLLCLVYPTTHTITWLSNTS